MNLRIAPSRICIGEGTREEYILGFRTCIYKIKAFGWGVREDEEEVEVGVKCVQELCTRHQEDNASVTSAIRHPSRHACLPYLRAGRRPICGDHSHMADAVAAARILHIMLLQRPGEAIMHFKDGTGTSSGRTALAHGPPSQGVGILERSTRQQLRRICQSTTG